MAVLKEILIFLLLPIIAIATFTLIIIDLCFSHSENRNNKAEDTTVENKDRSARREMKKIGIVSDAVRGYLSKKGEI